MKMTKLFLRLRCSWALILVLTSVWSCSAVPEVTFFTMAYSLLPHKKRNPPKALVESIRIRDLEITPAYDQDKIVYRFSPYQFQYYTYKLWAVKPHKMVSRLIKRHIEHSGLFRTVVSDLGDIRPQFELTGTLEAIEELDSGDEWYAHLTFSLHLSRHKDGRVIWSRRSNLKKRVYNKAPVYVVKALSELLENQMNTIIAELHAFLGRAKREGKL